MNRKKQKIFYLLLFIVSLILISVFVILAYFLKYEKDYIGVVEIKDEESFVRALENSSEIKQSRAYVLTQDITVHADLLVGNNYDFYGELDGSKSDEQDDCYTITIIASDDSSGSDAANSIGPIINTIMSGAKICNVNFVVDEDVVVNGAGGGTALLAVVNSGLISGCSFAVPQIVIDAAETYASAVAVKNFGEISYSSVIINSVQESSVTDKTDWKCYFGGVTAVNYGVINNIYISVSFKDLEVLNADASIVTADSDLPVADRWFHNYWIGFVCGINFIDASSDVLAEISEITLQSPGVYWQIASDHDMYQPVII